MTPDMPAMDENGLKAATEAVWQNEDADSAEIAKAAIAAYLAAAARDGEGTVEQIAECIWQAEWKRAGNGGLRKVPWSGIAEVDRDRYRFVAREVASLKAVPEVEVVAWRVLAEPDLPVHFARTKADADHMVDNLLKYRRGCTSARAEPLYATPQPPLDAPVKDFPPTSCNAWEDCSHDGLCHDPQTCGGIGPNHIIAALSPQPAPDAEVKP